MGLLRRHKSAREPKAFGGASEPPRARFIRPQQHERTTLGPHDTGLAPVRHLWPPGRGCRLFDHVADREADCNSHGGANVLEILTRRDAFVDAEMLERVGQDSTYSGLGLKKASQPDELG